MRAWWYSQTPSYPCHRTRPRLRRRPVCRPANGGTPGNRCASCPGSAQILALPVASRRRKGRRKDLQRRPGARARGFMCGFRPGFICRLICRHLRAGTAGAAFYPSHLPCTILEPLLLVELGVPGLGTASLAVPVGIGGGILMVPFMTYILGRAQVGPDLAVKMAIAASM